METVNDLLLKEFTLLSRDVDFSSLKQEFTDFTVERDENKKVSKANLDFRFKFKGKRKNFSCDYSEEHPYDGHFYIYFYRYPNNSGYLSYTKYLYSEEDLVSGASMQIETRYASEHVLDVCETIIVNVIEKEWVK